MPVKRSRKNRRQGLLTPCASAAELAAWVKEYRNLEVTARAVCPGHQAPLDYLWHAYHEPAADVVVWAPRGGGKTRLGALATLLDLLHKPPCQVRILGGSLEQSLRMWEHLYPDVLELAETQLEGRSRARRLQLVEGSSAAVLTQSQRAVRGLRVQKLRCDEVELFDPAVWDAAQLATRSRPADEQGPAVAGVVEAMSTLHAPRGLMQRILEQAQAGGVRIIRWCLLEVLQRCPQDRQCSACPLADDCRGVAQRACGGFVSIEDAIAMKRRVSRETWEAEMLCRRPAIRDCVFPFFDPAVHVRPGALAGPAEIWLAIDFGFAAPFVCLWVAAGEDGTVHVLDEYIQEQQTLTRHLERIAARPWSNVRHLACDPAGSARNEQTAESNVALLRAAGYMVHKKRSAIVDGLERIRTGLCPASGPPRLYIDPRCRRLIAALQGYRYAPGGSELPIKDGTHDHLIDALRYWYVNQPAAACGPPRRY